MLSVSALAFTACKDDDDDPTKPTDLTGAKQTAVATYASVASATYEDALSAARTLQTRIQAFVATPSPATLADARQAWKDARRPYGQTEAFRFYDGPIEEVEGLLNAWPLDENFIDYTSTQPTAGIINDVTTYPTLSKSLLVDLNENGGAVGGEKNISVGYHAIEFLLWGQDLSATGPGNRPYTDYLAGGTASNQARRGQYLLLCAELLVEHLEQVATEWRSTGAGTYRARLLAMPADSALQRILTGAGALGAGEMNERLQPALDTQDQEEEHSCFSDNTDQDVKLNQLGIRNVILGTYTRTDNSTVTGPSVLDAVRAADASAANTLATRLDAATAATQAIQAPFDQEILGVGSAGYNRVRAAVLACRAQSDQLVSAAAKLGFPLVFPN